MSSLAATQSDGYYLPPSYFTSKKYKSQSISQFQNSKGHNQYLQRGIVRFELPFDGFCLGCNCHAGKGTRFNAQKKEAGKYFSSKIWEFRMKCRSCAKQEFVIRTDPKNRTFEYVEGIKKKEEEWDVKEAGTLGVIDTDVGDGILKEGGEEEESVICKLESRAEGQRKIMTERDRMEALIRLNKDTMEDDSKMNSDLRTKYRSQRKEKKMRLNEARRLGLGGEIEIGDGTDVEKVEAVLAFEDESVRRRKVVEKEKVSFSKLRSGSIFGSRGNYKTALTLHTDFSRKDEIQNRSIPNSESRRHPIPIELKKKRKRKSLVERDLPSSDSTNSPKTTSLQLKQKETPPATESSLWALSVYASDSDD